MVSETIPMSTPKLHFDSTFYLPDTPVYLTNSKEQIKTRAGVCKTLCPHLPDSNTV